MRPSIIRYRVFGHALIVARAGVTAPVERTAEPERWPDLLTQPRDGWRWRR